MKKAEEVMSGKNSKRKHEDGERLQKKICFWREREIKKLRFRIYRSPLKEGESLKGRKTWGNAPFFIIFSAPEWNGRGSESGESKRRLSFCECWEMTEKMKWEASYVP